MKTPKKAWFIWFIATSFVQFQFMLQLGSGILIGAIMKDLQLSAFTAGLLSSAYYYIYVSLQTPAGMLFDRFNVRKILTIGAIICSLGCYLFAMSEGIYLAFFARLLMGGGASFAFVAMMTLIKQWFPADKLASIIGFSEALGLIGTITATIGLAAVINHIGWRNASYFAAFIALIIALLCWLFIEEKEDAIRQKKENKRSFKQSFKTVISDKLAWFNGLYVGIGFSTITVFSALWSIPFLETKLSTDLSHAALLTTFIYLGAVFGCPFYGYLSSTKIKRKHLLIFSSLSSALVFSIMVFIPSQSLWVHGALNLLLGLCCSSYMLTFSIADLLAPKGLINTYTGFTNAISVITAPCLQPLIGYLLDLQTPANVHVFTSAQYQNSLIIMPVLLVLSTFLLIPLPNEKEENIEPMPELITQ